MNIGITLTKHAYTPESYAYEKYLKNLGHKVQLDFEMNCNNDINIYFMGRRPFWNKSFGRAKEIHEYHSLSTPPYASLKNIAKKLTNVEPSGRIFLNSSVSKDLNFKDNIPFILRDMGVDEVLFQNPKKNPEYDIVYSGSIAGRVGLIKVLLSLAKKYKIMVVGHVSDNERKLLRDRNIFLLGLVSRDKLPEIYSNARYGLNYTPDLYPFNIQTSTKTLEYLASGLMLISNKYTWVETFCRSLQFEPIWLEDLKIKKLEDKVFYLPDMESFKWENILKESNFECFLKEILEN